VTDRARAWILIAYLAALLTLTHLPPGAPSPSWRLWDKLEHTFSYAALGFLAGWARSRRGSLRTTRIVLLLLALAALDELTQPIVGRDADPLDWLADGLGCIVGLAAASLWRRASRREG